MSASTPRLVRFLLVAAFALGAAALTPAQASALTCTPFSDFAMPPANAPLPGSCFEGFDGTQLDPDGIQSYTPTPPATPNRLDWQSLPSMVSGSGDYVVGSNDSQFGAGGSELSPDSWTFNVGSLGSSKFDAVQAWSLKEPNTAKLFLALGFIRKSNNGETHLAFELNQKQPGYRTAQESGTGGRSIKVPTRSTGDVLITYSMSNDNNPPATIGLCKWVGDEHSGIWTNQSGVQVDDCPTLNSSISQARLNDNTIPATENYLQGNTTSIDPGLFGEAVVNLTEAFKSTTGSIATPDSCVSFGYLWLHSRSAPSITSNQQDYILPEGPISVANCAVSGVKWHDVDGDGARETGDDPLGGWTIFVDYDNDGVLDNNKDATFNNNNDGTHVPGEEEPYAVTSSSALDKGKYLIANVQKGTWTVREESQTGWQCTSPSPCGHQVTMTGAEIPNKDFGNFEVKPAIDLTKTATLLLGADNKLAAGDKVKYDFVIKNTGNTTLTGVDLDDNKLAGFSNYVCGTATLAAGASTNCSGEYTLTQADIDSGSVSNSASACGDPPIGSEVCDPAGTTTPLGATKNIQLIKTATLLLGADNKLQAGDKVKYEFAITNIGNVTLTGVDLDDNKLPNYTDVTCGGVTTLAPGASTSCFAEYTLTQANIDAGSVTNLADACGDAPNNGGEVCDDDTTTQQLAPAKNIQLIKTATLQLGADNKLQAGDKVKYDFAITNIGNVTLSGVDLDDDKLAGFTNVTCGGVTTLIPGASTSCSGEYTLTQADIDAGSVTNLADACGDAPNNGGEVCDDDTTTQQLNPNKGIELLKTAALLLGGDNKLQAGDKVKYDFAIKNIGNVTLTGVDLDDSKLPGYDNWTCGQTTLAPNASTSCSGEYTLTQADIDAGSVTNLADACGDAPNNGGEVCDDDTTTTQLTPSKAITLKKTGTLQLGADNKLQAGDKVSYDFLITNTGNVTLTGVDLDDDKLTGFTNVTCGGVTTLAPGASTSCSGLYTLTQADIDAGSVTNVADACGDAPNNGGEVCDEDTTTTTLAPDKAIKLVKTATLLLGPDNKLLAGDKVKYDFAITNTGNVTLTGVDLDDSKLPGYDNWTCGATSLIPGASTGCSGEYTLTQADIDAGSVTNLADACGDAPNNGGEVCDDDTTTQQLNPNKGIQLVKTGTLLLGADNKLQAGDKIKYDFSIENIGNVTLTGVDLDDSKLPGYDNWTCGQTTLIPGATTGCSGEYTLTQADIDAGSVTNVADACGDAPNNGGEVCDDDSTTTQLNPAKGIELKKTGTLQLGADNKLQAGDKVKYDFVIKNIGNVTLTGVDLDDSKLAGFTDVTCGGVTTLAPDATTTCSGLYTLTQADIDNGSVTNLADACGDAPNNGGEVCDDDTTTTQLPPVKAIQLIKTATLLLGPDSKLAAGDKVKYEFAITNTGNVTLTGVDLDDSKLAGFSNVACGLTTLIPGASTSCSGEYTLTQADIDNGSVTNLADACGDAPNNGGEVCDEDTTTQPLDPTKGIQLIKTATLLLGPDNKLAAGDKVKYDFSITNIGNVTLTGVDLDDSKLAGFSNVACGLTTLIPGASTSCSGEYTLTQADIDTGSVTNLADACGDAPNNGGEVCDEDTTTQPLNPTKGIQLVKVATLLLGADNKLQAGDKVKYDFSITNMGNVTLSGVDLDDALVGYDNAQCDKTTLAPGASTGCSVEYTLKQSDIDAGSVTNLADACGDAPNNGGEVCDDDTTTIQLNPDKGIQLVKTGVLQLGADNKLAAGDKVKYDFAITNIGNVTLTGVDLDDALVGYDNAQCDKTTLAPGASTNCSTLYTLTQADIDNGSVTNVADACGDAPNNGGEVCDDDTTTVQLDPVKGIQLIKTATLLLGADNKLQAGDKVKYDFAITNTGNVTLTGVDLDDALVGFDNATCLVTTLAPGGTTGCSADYVLTQADIDKGSVTNLADVCGDAPKNGGEVCDDDTTTTTLDPVKGIQLVKTATLLLGADNKLQAGDKVKYDFAITNTGNVTLTGVDLDDSKLPGYDNWTCGQTTLAPGASTGCSGEYTLTQADIDNGSVTNLADACGDAPNNGGEVCDDDTTTQQLDPTKGIQLVKTATLLLGADNKLQAGDKVKYDFAITNTGNVTLTGVDLDDALVGFDNATCGVTTLAPGASTGCSAEYTLTQDDLDNGSVTNLADACGDAPKNGGEVCDDDTTTIELNPDKGLQLVKTGVLGSTGPAKVGDKITYTFEITNTGNTTLTDLNLDDALIGYADAACGQFSLAPGAKTNCTAVYTVTQADIDAGSVTNLATACGQAPNEQEVCDDDTTTTELPPTFGIQVVKDGPATTYHGESVTYTFVVTSTGRAPIAAVKLTDDKCSAVTGPVKAKGDVDDLLEPGEEWTYTCTKTVGDHAAGEENPIVNTATATGTAAGNAVSDTDTHSTLVLHPAVAIDKSGPNTAQAGTLVGFQLIVTNPGDVPVIGQTLKVTDPKCDAPPALVAKNRGNGADPTPDTLDPGDSWIYGCKAPTTVGQTSLVNQAFVEGTDPNGKVVTNNDTVTTPLTQPAVEVLPDAVISGASRLQGPAGCVSKAFSARISGRRIATVTVTIDGKRVKRKVFANGEGKKFSYRINPAKYGNGTHRVRVRVTYNREARTAARTLSLTFARCARVVVKPRFTG